MSGSPPGRSPAQGRKKDTVLGGVAEAVSPAGAAALILGLKMVTVSETDKPAALDAITHIISGVLSNCIAAATKPDLEKWEWVHPPHEATPYDKADDVERFVTSHTEDLLARSDTEPDSPLCHFPSSFGQHELFSRTNEHLLGRTRFLSVSFNKSGRDQIHGNSVVEFGQQLLVCLGLPVKEATKVQDLSEAFRYIRVKCEHDGLLCVHVEDVHLMQPLRTERDLEHTERAPAIDTLAKVLNDLMVFQDDSLKTAKKASPVVFFFTCILPDVLQRLEQYKRGTKHLLESLCLTESVKHENLHLTDNTSDLRTAQNLAFFALAAQAPKVRHEVIPKEELQRCGFCFSSAVSDVAAAMMMPSDIIDEDVLVQWIGRRYFDLATLSRLHSHGLIVKRDGVKCLNPLAIRKTCKNRDDRKVHHNIFSHVNRLFVADTTVHDKKMLEEVFIHFEAAFRFSLHSLFGMGGYSVEQYFRGSLMHPDLEKRFKSVKLVCPGLGGGDASFNLVEYVPKFIAIEKRYIQKGREAEGTKKNEALLADIKKKLQAGFIVVSKKETEPDIEYLVPFHEVGTGKIHLAFVQVKASKRATEPSEIWKYYTKIINNIGFQYFLKDPNIIPFVVLYTLGSRRFESITDLESTLQESEKHPEASLSDCLVYDAPGVMDFMGCMGPMLWQFFTATDERRSEVQDHWCKGVVSWRHEEASKVSKWKKLHYPEENRPLYEQEAALDKLEEWRKWPGRVKSKIEEEKCEALLENLTGRTRPLPSAPKRDQPS